MPGLTAKDIKDMCGKYGLGTLTAEVALSTLCVDKSKKEVVKDVLKVDVYSKNGPGKGERNVVLEQLDEPLAETIYDTLEKSRPDSQGEQPNMSEYIRALGGDFKAEGFPKLKTLLKTLGIPIVFHSYLKGKKDIYLTEAGKKALGL